MVLVSYFSVLIGLSFSHIGYYLNVFDGLWKIGGRCVGKFRVPNRRRKTGLDYLVRSKVKSSPMVEIRPTGQSGLWKPT